VPLGLVGLLGSQLVECGLQAVLDFPTHQRVRLDGRVLARVDGEGQTSLDEVSRFAFELGDTLNHICNTGQFVKIIRHSKKEG
jgi:hypothetical protein